MTEERIKERCKREDIALKIVKGFLKKDCYTDTELNYSLNTLLELYDKQKEENKKDIKGYSKMINSLEEQLASKVKEIEELKNTNIKLSEEKQLNKEGMIIANIDITEDNLKDYISKDKIRDKIKELEKDIEIFSNDGCDTKHFTYCKEILNELLED